VHRPARHGRNVDSAAAIGSELDRLKALRPDTGLQVPEPPYAISQFVRPPWLSRASWQRLWLTSNASG